MAAGCLKHSLPGDVNLVSRAEVKALAGGSGAGRVEAMSISRRGEVLNRWVALARSAQATTTPHPASVQVAPSQESQP